MSSFEDLSEAGAVPSVGVMLATYNGEMFVAEQIESILDQRGVVSTIYVRDDGSSDRTLEVVRSCSETHPSRIILLDNAPRRFSTASGNFFSMLADVRRAPHAYFAFSDQDDIWLPEKLERAVGRLRESGASGYASNLTAFSEARGAEWTMVKAGPQKRFDHLFQAASAGCTYVFDQKAAELIAMRIGPVDDQDWWGVSHDWLCYSICRSHGLSWVIDDWSCIRYRQHEQNFFGAQSGLKGALKRLSLIREGWYRDTVVRNRRFLDPDNMAERPVLDRVARLNLGDRLWLAAHVGDLRREPKAQLALAAALILGLI